MTDTTDLGPLPDYIRNELPDDLAAQRVQRWGDARVAAERERCARVCEGRSKHWERLGDAHASDEAFMCAADIRQPVDNLPTE